MVSAGVTSLLPVSTTSYYTTVITTVCPQSAVTFSTYTAYTTVTSTTTTSSVSSSTIVSAGTTAVVPVTLSSTISVVNTYSMVASVPVIVSSLLPTSTTTRTYIAPSSQPIFSAVTTAAPSATTGSAGVKVSPSATKTGKPVIYTPGANSGAKNAPAVLAVAGLMVVAAIF